MRSALVPALALATISGLGAAACTDFASPAELTKPTVLAVIADPPIVGGGATTELSIAMAGPDGPVEPDDVTWAVVETLPGVAPYGTVDGDGVTATYTAPAEAPPVDEDTLPVDSVECVITAGDETVRVIKAIVIADLPSANPAITAFTVGGDEAADGMRIGSGEAVALEIATDPEPGEDATYAWYSTVGLIDQFQSNPTELIGADEAGDGWLFIVMRDGRGGVAWRGVSIEVE